MADGLIRAARPADVPEILELVRALAEYERAPDQVLATHAQVHTALFEGSATPSGSPAVWCNVVEHQDPSGARLGGLVMWFLTYSTWIGAHGIHIEDLFVRPQLRARGYGKALLGSVASECVTRGYQRLEWSVLAWNTPSINFYLRLGAKPLDHWVTYRVTGEALEKLAQAPTGR